MKKSLKTILATAGLALTFGLSACGSVSQSYADKINAAAATKDPDDDYTYDKVMKDLGTPVLDATAEVLGTGKSGIVTWYKGCKSADDLKKKTDAGKDVESIAVTFLAGKATIAVYTVVPGNAD